MAAAVVMACVSLAGYSLAGGGDDGDQVTGRVEDPHTAGDVPVHLGHPALSDVPPVAGEAHQAAIWISDRSPMHDVRAGVESSGGASRDEGASARRVPVGGGVDEWLRGYRAEGGPGEYERRFVEAVIPCESGWQIEPGNPSYIGPMQWHSDSWSRIDRAIGPLDRYSWYDHGRATAWWVVRIEQPGGSGGWPTCWWR